jgi:transposase InsO family protein
MIALVCDLRDRGYGLSVTRMAAALNLSRPSVYRVPGPPRSDEAAVRSAILQIAAEFTRYGYRPVARELRRRHWIVNEKRVRRIMRDEHLKGSNKRFAGGPKYVRHHLPIYPNRAAESPVTDLNQLWVSDLTYVRLRSYWIFVAVILDAFSRRCIGWALETHLGVELTLGALQMALARRRPGPGLIHHSDQGVQYAALEYVALLREHGIAISMSRAGKPNDNAACERFIRTLKQDEVDLRDYQGVEDARRFIGRFLDDVYNHKRLHSAIGWLPPAEFEEQHLERRFTASPA